MGFVVGAVVALIVVFLLAYITIKKPVFGEVIIAISVLMILAATFFYFQKDNRVENKKSLIPLDEIQLSDIFHSLAYGYYHKLNAHLQNNSKTHRLQSIILAINFYECPGNRDAIKDVQYESCRLLTEKQHKVDTRLAAQQGSDIETYVLLDDEILVEAYNALQAEGSLLAEGSLPAEGSSPTNKTIQWQIKLINGIAR